MLEFSEKLIKLSLAEPIALNKGLKIVANKIKKTAQNKIGHYQDQVGPFQDWAPLAQSTENEKERLGFNREEPLLRTGELRDSIECEVKFLEAVIGSKSDIAAYQEFGTKYIPPRPFIGPAAYENKEKIKKILGAAVVSGLIEGAPIHRLLGYDMLIDEGENP